MTDHLCDAPGLSLLAPLEQTDALATPKRVGKSGNSLFFQLPRLPARVRSTDF